MSSSPLVLCSSKQECSDNEEETNRIKRGELGSFYTFGLFGFVAAVTQCRPFALFCPFTSHRRPSWVAPLRFQGAYENVFVVGTFSVGGLYQEWDTEDVLAAELSIFALEWPEIVKKKK